MQITSSAKAQEARHRWEIAWPLILLSVVALANNIDWNSLYSLAGTVQHQFHLSDTQLAMIENSPVLLSAIFGVLIAAYADRSHRLRIVAFGMLVWAGLTGLRGLANSFVPLLVLCALSGIGYGSFAAPSTSLLCDLYSPQVRSQVLGFQGAAQYLGSFLGFLLPGLLLLILDWRLIFVAVAAFALIFFVPLLRLREPARGALEGYAHQPEESWWINNWQGVSSLFRTEGGRVAVFGLGIQALSIGAIGSFLAIFLTRYFVLPPSAADDVVALVVFIIVFGAAGGGILAGSLRKRVGVGSYAVVAGAATFALGLLFTLAVVLYAFLGLLWFTMLTVVCGVLLGITLAPLSALVGDKTSPAHRSLAYAVQLFVATLFQACGGIGLGIISDRLHSLQGAYVLFSIVLIAVGIWMILRFRAIQDETGKESQA